MAQIDLKGRLNNPVPPAIFPPEPIHDINENKNGRLPLTSEGTITSGSTSAKSSVKELVRNQKAPNHRKSKSQNRARKALRTITFILGMYPSVRNRLKSSKQIIVCTSIFLGAFVVCWTPW
jgi:hypothetical protein